MKHQSAHRLSESQPLISRRIYLLCSAVLFVASLVLTACAAPAPAAAPATQPIVGQTAAPTAKYAGKKIVFINSYHEGYEWSDGVERGIHNVVDGTGAQVKFI